MWLPVTEFPQKISHIIGYYTVLLLFWIMRLRENIGRHQRPGHSRRRRRGHTVGMESVGGHSRRGRGRADMHINDIMYKCLLPWCSGNKYLTGNFTGNQTRSRGLNLLNFLSFFFTNLEGTTCGSTKNIIQWHLVSLNSERTWTKFSHLWQLCCHPRQDLWQMLQWYRVGETFFS